MAQPFIAEKGVLRVSPLEKVVAARSNPSSQSSEGNDASATPGSKDGNKGLPPGVDEQDVVEAQAKAEAGDQTAIAWLKGLGIAVGTAATAYGIHRVLSSRKKKTLPQMGADDIAATAASPNATTAVAKRARRGPDLYIDITGTQERPAGYLPDGRRLPNGTVVDPSLVPGNLKRIGNNYKFSPLGPTEKRMQEEAAYAQAAALKAKAAKRAAETSRPVSGRTAAAERAFLAAEAMKAIRRLP